MRRDILLAIGIATAIATALVCGWSFIQWQLPPAPWDWTPFSRGLVIFAWITASGYALLMRRMLK